MNVLRTDMGQPYAITVSVPASSSFDPTEATGAEIVAVRPDRTVVTWTAAIVTQTAQSITITHPFALGELAVPGMWLAKAQFTVPGQTPGPQSLPFSFPVKDPFTICTETT